MYEYTIIKNRGVVSNAAPYLLEETNPLLIKINSINSSHIYKISYKQETAQAIGAVSVQDGIATIQRKRIKTGLLYLDLIKYEGNKAVSKIPLTPITVTSLLSQTQGLMCYPSIDEVIRRMAELEQRLAVVEQFIISTAPLIHTHTHTP